MKLPTQEQEDAVIAADMLLTFIVKVEFRNEETRKLIETKLTQYYARLEADEQNEALFLEAALTFIRGITE